MKLLLDQNLSPKLVTALADMYPGINHVQALGLGEAGDEQVWQYAKDNGYTIVSKDVDFNERGLLLGFPPRVIWIRVGNCSTARIERILRDARQSVLTMHSNEDEGTLELV
jgi:predicted nuclease of predicted toxin-antitoxin system